MVYVIFLLVFTTIYIYIKRDLFDPGVLTCLTWSIVLIAYIFVEHPLNSLSEKFFITITFWSFLFATGSFISSNFKFKYSKYIGSEIHVSIKTMYPMLMGAILFSLVTLFIVSKSMNLSLIGLVRNIGLSKEIETPLSIKLVNFITTISVALVFCIMSFGKTNTIKKVSLFVPFLIIIVLSGSKAGVFQCFFTILFLVTYKKKIQLWKMILLITVTVSLILIVTLLRDKNPQNDIVELLYIYLLSPLPAFDLILTGKIIPNSVPVGTITLGLIYRIISTFTPISIPALGLGFVNVPVPTNVYTILLTGYIDFGYYGMFIFSFFYGIIWGYFYSFVKRNMPFTKILYSIFYYCLVFQFFADFVFPYLAIFIYQICFVFFVFVRIKKNNCRPSEVSYDRYCYGNV